MPEDEWLESGRYVHHPDLKIAIKRLFLNRPSRAKRQGHAPLEFQEAFPYLVDQLRSSVHWLRDAFDRADWQGRWRDAYRFHADAWVALERAYENAWARHGWKKATARRKSLVGVRKKRTDALRTEHAKWQKTYRSLRADGEPVGVAQEMVAEKYRQPVGTVRRWCKG